MEINSFLREFKSSNDPTHTHVSMGAPAGIYSIGSKIVDFWALYLQAVKNEQPLYLAENPGKETPILVDIDLRVKLSNVNRVDSAANIYTDEQVKRVIQAYQNAITEVVADPREESYTCVLFEKPSTIIEEINGEKYVKNGFHLHFPKIFLDRKVQEVYLIPIVKKAIPNLFDNLGVKDFIDVNSTVVHWLMYGSKKQGGQPYQATRCFLKNAVETSFQSGLGDYVCNCYPGDTNCQVREDNVMDMLPRILSISLYDRAPLYYFKPKPSVITPLFEEFNKIKRRRKEYDQLSVDEALNEACNYLNIMSDSRADDRATWLRVGFCIWNITEGDDDGLTAWLEFSERSDKFDESECLSLWQKMRVNKFTIGTLKYYAKQDNPDEYEKVINAKTRNLVVEAVNGSHNDLAKIMYNEYNNEFVCTSIANKEWYQFKDHIWKNLERGHTLRERISSRDGIIIKQMTSKKRELYSSIEETQDPSEKKDLQNMLSRISKLIIKCKDTPFKNHVMVESQEVFYNPKFYNLLNKDRYLIAFKNGVYDFENNVFRDGNPEDYLSVNVPIDYIDYGTVDHPAVMEVDLFFQKVFPDSEVREYFLYQACQVFVGGNADKVMLFWTGEGNNGKTVTQTLFEKMLGCLAIKFNTTLITGKKTQTGSANPEMARSGDGVRWAVMEEPNPDETISSGILKGLTGNDSFWARDLFQKGKEAREINPLFKLHMICNKLPAIRDADKATWNRIRVIPFESTFLSENECPSELEEQIKQKKFPVDKNFIDKIPSMVEPLAWYLIQKWKSISSIDFIVPDKVTAATDIYRQSNDLLRQFERQCVFELEGSNLSLTTLYYHFKDWYKEECPNSNIPNRSCIRQYYTKLWGEPINGRYWINKSIKLDESDSLFDEITRKKGNPMM